MPFDPADLDLEEVEEQDDPLVSDNLTRVRNWGKTQARLAKQAEKRAADIEARFQAQSKELTRLQATSAGLTEDQINTLFEIEPNADWDKIQKMASVFRPPASTEGTAPAPEEVAAETAGFTPAAGGAAVPGKKMSMDEFHALQRTDPLAARQAFKDGKVDAPTGL